jgi:hypothetical protein
LGVDDGDEEDEVNDADEEDVDEDVEDGSAALPATMSPRHGSQYTLPRTFRMQSLQSARPQ